MFRIPGVIGKDLCDNHLGSSRRDILRVGGAGIMGLTLNNILRGQAMANTSPSMYSWRSGWAASQAR